MQDEASERLANLMFSESLATGHGDTFLDMWREFEGQTIGPKCARAVVGVVPIDFGTCAAIGLHIGEAGSCLCKRPY